MYYTLVFALRMAKFFHDIGIYQKAVGDIESICGDDYYELFINGLAHVSPVYEYEELPDDYCCGGHIIHRFSDPAIPEYYRLCRLYEYKHSVEPCKNPYAVKADEFFCERAKSTYGNFGAGFDDDVHIRALQIELCPEYDIEEYDLLVFIYDIMEYYRREVVSLRNDLGRGPAVWLPELPAPKEAERFEQG